MFGFIRGFFGRSESSKYNIVKNKLNELSELFKNYHQLFLKKSKDNANIPEILQKQQQEFILIKQKIKDIEKRVYQFSHNMFKEEQKDVKLLDDEIKDLEINLFQQINKFEKSLLSKESETMDKISKNMKKLNLIIKTAIFQSTYIIKKEFGDNLKKMLDSFPGVDKIVNKYSLIFNRMGANTNNQKRFVLELIREISKTKFGKWSFFFSVIHKKKQINCSGSATFLGMILKSSQKTNKIPLVEFCTPVGHALILVTFPDNRMYYCDAINNLFVDITKKIDLNRSYNLDSIKVYKLKEMTKEFPYLILPAVDFRKGMINTYSSNLRQMLYEKLNGDNEAEEFLRYKKEIRDEIKRLSKSNNLDKEFNKLYRSNEYRVEQDRVKKLRTRFKEYLTPLLFILKDERYLQLFKNNMDEIKSYLLFKKNSLSIGDSTFTNAFKNFKIKVNNYAQQDIEGYKKFIKDNCEKISNMSNEDIMKSASKITT